MYVNHSLSNIFSCNETDCLSCRGCFIDSSQVFSRYYLLIFWTIFYEMLKMYIILELCDVILFILCIHIFFYDRLPKANDNYKLLLYYLNNFSLPILLHFSLTCCGLTWLFYNKIIKVVLVEIGTAIPSLLFPQSIDVYFVKLMLVLFVYSIVGGLILKKPFYRLFTILYDI